MDTLESLWRDLSDRFKSPFVISFILSWLVWNWALVYSIFNFDHDYFLDDRLFYLNQYFVTHHWYGTLLVVPVITSFGAAAFFYLAKTAFLVLDSFYENRLRIAVIKFVGVQEMVPLTDLENRTKELDSLKRAIQEKDNLYSSNQTEIDGYKQVIANNGLAYNAYSAQNPPLEVIQSLDKFFLGQWICEFNWIKDDYVNSGAEHFTIRDHNYLIQGKIYGFVVYDANYDHRLNVLAFKKKNAERINEFNVVRLLRINENLWSGIEEMHGGFLSYIRIYSSQNRPNHVNLVLNKATATGLNNISSPPGRYDDIVNKAFY